MQRRLQVATTQQGCNFLLQVFGLAFFEQEHAAFVGTKIGDLFWHQRASHIEHQHGNFAVAKSIGQIKLLQGANQGVVQTALHDQA